MSSVTKGAETNADPDYENVQDENLGEVNESLQREDARDHVVQKIQKIIHEQFSFEIDLKGKEVTCINRRINECRTSLDRLRACVLAGYYGYGITPMHCRQGSVRTGKTRKSCLKETSIHDIMNWKRSLPSNLQEQPPNESTNESSANEVTSRFVKQTGSNETKSTPSNNGERNAKDLSASLKHDLSNESRFYVKRRIIIGNTSKYVLPENREGNDKSTHKWMVYVRGPKDDGDLQNFISKVWFLLHPSYQPNDLVEVCKPPFQVTRRGWGEFPVRVQLHFVENKNKRVDIIHHLKLDKTYTGLQTLGAETHVDVELDRKNFDDVEKPLVDNRSAGSGKTNIPLSSSCFDLACTQSQKENVDCKSLNMDQTWTRLGKYEHGILTDHSYSATEVDSLHLSDMKYRSPPTITTRGSTPNRKVQVKVEEGYETQLQKVVEKFPIVNSAKCSNMAGYSSTSLEKFLAWNLGKRLAAEWQRALAMKLYVVNEMQSPGLSTKAVMNYCRFHGHTPMADISCEEATICKFCGEENDSIDNSDEDDDDEEAGFAHEECASEFDEEFSEIPQTTAQEFLEMLAQEASNGGKDHEIQEDQLIDVDGSSDENVPKDSFKSVIGFLPVTQEHEWIQQIASEVNVMLSNCDIDGIHAPVTSAMLYKACLMFVQEIVRKANRFTWKSPLSIPRAKCILPVHVKKALEVIPYCDFLTNNYLKVDVDNDEKKS